MVAARGKIKLVNPFSVNGSHLQNILCEQYDLSAYVIHSMSTTPELLKITILSHDVQ
jgi:hypothetical protein